MARSRKEFWKRINERLPGVPRDPYQTLIERYQPYRRSTIGRAMRALRNFSDMDKHRTIVPTTVYPLDLNISASVRGGRLVGSRLLIDRGTPIRTREADILQVLYTVDTPSQSHVDVRGEITPYPELPGRMDLAHTMGLIRDSCEEIITQIGRVP